MKHCPTCNRTYTDDSINFCLADGSFLSSPDDPEVIASPIERPAAAPTEILPAAQLTGGKPDNRTQPSPAPALTRREMPPANKQRLLLWVICGAMLIGIAVVVAYLINSSREKTSNTGISSASNSAVPGEVETPSIANSDSTPRTEEVVIPNKVNVNAGSPGAPVKSDPALPAAGVVVDPELYEDERFGDPRSQGPGKSEGIGQGEGAGRGSGDKAEDSNRIFNPKEVTQKARILSRPEPQYTEEARKNQVSGAVVLRAVFTASGQVTNVRAVAGLPYGLTEKAIDAARRIRFTPAMKDGRPVSQYIQLEYNFSLY